MTESIRNFKKIQAELADDMRELTEIAKDGRLPGPQSSFLHSQEMLERREFTFVVFGELKKCGLNITLEQLKKYYK